MLAGGDLLWLSKIFCVSFISFCIKHILWPDDIIDIVTHAMKGKMPETEKKSSPVSKKRLISKTNEMGRTLTVFCRFDSVIKK